MVVVEGIKLIQVFSPLKCVPLEVCCAVLHRAPPTTACLNWSLAATIVGGADLGDADIFCWLDGPTYCRRCS